MPAFVFAMPVAQLRSNGIEKQGEAFIADYYVRRSDKYDLPACCGRIHRNLSTHHGWLRYRGNYG
jgi:hypothetical protein